MTHYLKKWICPNCSKHNLGCEFECPSCNGPRTVDVKWYVPDPLIEATDEQWKYMGKGPNWFCTYCGCENPEYNKTNCLHCGAPIGKPKTVNKVRGVPLSGYARSGSTAKAQDTHEVDHGDAGWNIPEESNETPTPVHVVAHPQHKVQQQRTDKPRTTISPPAQFTSNQVPWLQIGGFGSIILMLFTIAYFVWYWKYDTTTQIATITGWHWEQRVDEYHYQTLSKEDWRSNMPSDAYNQSCVDAIREHNKRVSDGYENVQVNTTCPINRPVQCDPEDDGNGGITIPSGCTETVYEPCTKTERQEKFKYIDVHEDYCSYDIDKWVYIQSYPTDGYDHTPYYFSTPANTNTVRFDQIPGTYTVNFSSDFTDPTNFSFNYDYYTWQMFQQGSTVNIEVNRSHTVPFAPDPAQ